jgi:4-aminobutyrate aminotransferase
MIRLDKDLSFSVALALPYLLEKKSDPDADLIVRCATVGDKIKQHIVQESKDSATIDQVRGRGFFIGIELVADRKTRAPLHPKALGRIVQQCEKRGVRVMACGRYGSVIRLMPPLVITREHLRNGTNIRISMFVNATTLASAFSAEVITCEAAGNLS